MRKIIQQKIVDPVYGEFKFGKLEIDLINTPEMQRLRDIRQLNINSLYRAGVSNISRFEHSVGTAYLCKIIGETLRFNEKDQKILTSAGLLHDIATPPFGHTVEYVLKKHFGFDHEEKSKELIIGHFPYPIFANEMPSCNKILKEHGVSPDKVVDCLEGKGVLGELIKKDFDLDNIDNVIRMAVHSRNSKTRYDPVKIVRGFSLKGNKIVYNYDLIDEIKKWFATREEEYDDFFDDHHDWSAKAVIAFTTERAIQAGIIREQDWIKTDNEFIIFLSNERSCSKVAFSNEIEKRKSVEDYFLFNYEEIFKILFDIHPHKRDLDRVTDILNTQLLTYIEQEERIKTTTQTKLSHDQSSVTLSFFEIDNFLRDLFYFSKYSSRTKEIFVKHLHNSSPHILLKLTPGVIDTIFSFLEGYRKASLSGSNISFLISDFRRGIVPPTIGPFHIKDGDDINMLKQKNILLEVADEMEIYLEKSLSNEKGYTDYIPVQILVTFIPMKLGKKFVLNCVDNDSNKVTPIEMKKGELQTRWLLSISPITKLRSDRYLQEIKKIVYDFLSFKLVSPPDFKSDFQGWLDMWHKGKVTILENEEKINHERH